MASTTRSAAVIGAGIAGTTAALGLVDAGFDVTLYSDRDRRSLRDDVPPTGTAVLFGKSKDYDASIIEDLYSVGNTSGISARLYAGDGADRAQVLEFNPDFHYDTQAVDVRLRSDDRLGRFLERGGRFEVRSVDPTVLDEIAGSHDLTLVATGKGGLAQLFGVDESRTVYDRPQRHLLQIVLKGLDQGEDVFAYRNREGGKHDLYNLDADNGEAWLGPYLHKDEGVTWAFLGFAKPEGQWVDRFAAATDRESARQIVLDLYRDYFPHDLPEVEKLEIVESDEKSWAKGAVTPVVRNATATTASGHVVAAIGDTAIAVDPVAGQGAQNALVQVSELVRAAAAHDGPFTADWLSERFEEFWELRGHAAVEVTRLFLGHPDYAEHLELAFPAAAVNTDIASALFGLLSDPNPLLTLKTRDDILGFISAVAGEPAEDVLAKFSPAGDFTRAEPVPA